MNHGYVYFVQNIHRPGEIKIGRSVNGAESRIQSWNTGSPGAFKLLGQVHVDDCVYAEAEMHRRLRRRRTQGEFFRVEYLEAAAVLESMFKKPKKASCGTDMGALIADVGKAIAIIFGIVVAWGFVYGLYELFKASPGAFFVFVSVIALFGAFVTGIAIGLAKLVGSIQAAFENRKKKREQAVATVQDGFDWSELR